MIVDPYYLTHKAEEVGYSPQVILAGRRINDNMAHYAAKAVIKRMVQRGINIARSSVAVLGLTFKENCPDIRNSKVVDLVRELQSWNIKVKVADPWADPTEAMSEYGIELIQLSKLGKNTAIIIAVGHQQFRELSVSDLREMCLDDQAVIGDLKSLYDKDKLMASGFNVFSCE